MLDKLEIIHLLKEAAFDSREYWVTSGAAMVLYGIRDRTRDIDLGCTSQMADKLEKEGYSAENWLEDRAVLLEGLPVVSLDGLIRMKETLGREKDRQDILLINEYRTRRSRP